VPPEAPEEVTQRAANGDAPRRLYSSKPPIATHGDTVAFHYQLVHIPLGKGRHRARERMIGVIRPLLGQVRARGRADSATVFRSLREMRLRRWVMGRGCEQS
jgi:hypothetical protein